MFLLNESMMNGTVTMRVTSRTINAPSFEEAVQYVRKVAAQNGAIFENEITNDAGWSYTVKQQDPSPGYVIFGCNGFLSRTEVQML
jgi:hypothetical protein